MFRPAWILASLLLVSTLAKGQLMTDTVPYCCDFENAAERAYWRLANTATSNSNKWIINQAVQNGPGQYSLYISNDNVRLDSGFVDTFRYFYPDLAHIYSWWSYRFRARENNAGWRIDYFVCSERLKALLTDAKIHTEVMGSDHCPVELTIDL